MRKRKKKRNHNKGICPKCGDVKSLTKHHCLPRRWFKCKHICLICRSCHNDLEVVILKEETLDSKQPIQLKKYRYYKILNDFLKQDPD